MTSENDHTQTEIPIMDYCEIFLELRPKDIAYVKFIFESYESVGIIRTVNRKKAVIVVMVLNDFQETARLILDCLKKEMPLVEISQPRDLGDDWLLRMLVTENSLR